MNADQAFFGSFETTVLLEMLYTRSLDAQSLDATGGLLSGVFWAALARILLSGVLWEALRSTALLIVLHVRFSVFSTKFFSDWRIN